MSSIILNHTFKTTTPLINAIVNKTLRQFFPLSGCCSLHFFHCVKFSSMVDSLLKGPQTAQSTGLRVKTGDVCGPQVRLDEINLLFLQIICGITYCVHWHTILLKCPFVLVTSCLDIRQQTHSQDESKWYELLTFASRSMKIMFVLPMRDTPAKNITF